MAISHSVPNSDTHLHIPLPPEDGHMYKYILYKIAITGQLGPSIATKLIQAEKPENLKFSALISLSE